jgi:hypothetical protein
MESSGFLPGLCNSSLEGDMRAERRFVTVEMSLNSLARFIGAGLVGDRLAIPQHDGTWKSLVPEADVVVKWVNEHQNPKLDDAMIGLVNRTDNLEDAKQLYEELPSGWPRAKLSEKFPEVR